MDWGEGLGAEVVASRVSPRRVWRHAHGPSTGPSQATFLGLAQTKAMRRSLSIFAEDALLPWAPLSQDAGQAAHEL